MTKKQSSRLRRKSAPPIRLTDRDRDIILALHRIMSLVYSRRDITQTSLMRKMLSYANTLERGLAFKRFEMKGFQVLTTSEERIKAIQAVIAELPEKCFSAGTFLFKNQR